MAIDSLRITELTKRYGYHRALANVSLELRAGRLCALLGPNGAGKSTLLGILSTLVQATAGEVVYLDGDAAVPSDDALRGQIGVLAHESFVYGDLTGLENLLFYGRLYGVASVNERARARLDQVGLDEEARDRPARTYSRGMTQRLALARALLHDPHLLLLDEPFTGLDRTGAKTLGQTLGDAKAEGRIVVVVTHDLEAIEGVTDHVAVLNRGRLVHEASHDAGFSYQALKDCYHRYTE